MKLKKVVLRAVVKSIWAVAGIFWPFNNTFSSFVFQKLSKVAVIMDAKHKLNTWPTEE